MNALHLLLWVALPYIAITVFIAGHIWRYRTDQYGWTTRSTQLLESRKLKWGSILFHYGALAAIGGHVLGILVPASWTSAFGINEHSYHLLSAAAGTLAGMACVVGFVILAWRRITSTRVRVTTSRMDIAVYALLGLVIGLGIAETIGRNTLGGGYDYRATVAVWFRSIIFLHPDRRSHGRHPNRLPVPRDRRLAALPHLAIHSPRARLEHPTPISGATVHPLPPPMVTRQTALAGSPPCTPPCSAKTFKRSRSVLFG